MDLFGPVNVLSIGKKQSCLVIVNDFSIFSWVFFLAKKIETAQVLMDHISRIEIQFSKSIKSLRSDNGTEFKNEVFDSFCIGKGITRQFSSARTPQQNRVVERKNRTLIEAARSMLADSELPITFWAEAVNIACYVQNRSFIVKDQNKTPCEIMFHRKPSIHFLKAFGCPCSILNTRDRTSKFASKTNDGYFVG